MNTTDVSVTHTGCAVSKSVRARSARWPWIVAAVGCSLACGFAAPARAQLIDGFAPLMDGRVLKTVVQPDGGILFGGTFATVDGSPRTQLARVATDGTLDTGFDPVINPLADIFGISDLAIQPDGDILVAYGFGITRLHPDGTQDATFDPGFGPVLYPGKIALQADGKIVLGDDANDFPYLGRLNADGSADDSFEVSRTYDGVANQIVALPDGKIIVAGSFDSFGDSSHGYLVRLRPDGSVDDSFEPDPDGTVYAVTPLPDGDMLVAGCFGHIGGADRNGLARLDRNGNARSTFNHAIAGGTNGCAMALATDSWGVIVGGDFDHVDSTLRSNMARILWSDSLDPSYDPDVVGIVDTLAVQGDGKAVAGGAIEFIGNHFRSYLARVNPDGSADDLFGAGTDGPVQALAAWSDNSLVIGGAYTRVESSQGAQTAVPGLAWIKADGDDPVPGFVPQEICAVPFCGVQAIALQPDDRKIVLGHSFFTVGRIDGTSPAAKSQPRTPGGTDPNAALPVMRLFPNGLIDPAFDLNAQAWLDGDVYAVLRQPDGQVLVAGCLTAGGTPNVMVVRLNADGTQDFSFSPLLNNGDDCSLTTNNYAALALALLPDGRIAVGGEFYYFVDPFAQAPNFALLRSNGLPDRPVLADGPVLALASQPDGRVLVGGAFSAVNDSSPAHLARMNPDSSMDGSFAPVVNAAVRAVSVRADGKIFIGGDFTIVDGATRTYLALLGGAGEVQQNFHHDIDAPVQALAVQSDGKVAFGGQFTTVDGLPHAHVARVSVPDPARYAISYVPRPPLAPWIYWASQGAGAAAGAAPELSYSLDGVTYTDVGAMSYDANAQHWTFGTFALPLDHLVFLRVREATAGGSLETVLPVFNADEIFRDGFD